MDCNNIYENIRQLDPCDNNMSGVQRLLYIPRKHVESINALTAVVTVTYGDIVEIGSEEMEEKAITVQSGRAFGEIFCADQLGELIYTPQGAKKCRSFKASLEIYHPGLKKQVAGYMATALNTDFVMLVQLANGLWHLLGNTLRGCRLTDNSKLSSGKTITDANGAECHFEISVPKPFVFYAGWDPDNEVNGIERWRTAWLLTTEDGYYITTEDGYFLEV